MNIQSKMYRILSLLALCSPVPVKILKIVKKTGIEESEILELMKMMENPPQKIGFYGPMVVASGADKYNISGVDRYDVKTGGYEYMDDCERRPQLQRDSIRWKNEALTGITESGQKTKITNPVIPRGEKKKYRDPETSAYQTNKKLL